MLGIDTNVLVRFLVRDDEIQYEKARRLIRREAGADEAVFVSVPVLLETEWVLRSRYGLSKGDIAAAFSGMLDATEVRFEDEPSVEETLFVWEQCSADFADCLIGVHNRRQGCRATASFDARTAALPDFVVL